MVGRHPPSNAPSVCPAKLQVSCRRGQIIANPWNDSTWGSESFKKQEHENIVSCRFFLILPSIPTKDLPRLPFLHALPMLADEPSVPRNAPSAPRSESPAPRNGSLFGGAGDPFPGMDSPFRGMDGSLRGMGSPRRGAGAHSAERVARSAELLTPSLRAPPRSYPRSSPAPAPSGSPPGRSLLRPRAG